MRLSAWLQGIALVALVGCTAQVGDGSPGEPTSEAEQNLFFPPKPIGFGKKVSSTHRYIRLRFLRFADDNGANAAVLTETNVKNAIDAVNAIFYQSGSDLRVERDWATNLNTIYKSTNFNNACSPINNWQLKAHDANGDGVVNDADAAYVCPPLPSDRDMSVSDNLIASVQGQGALPVLVRGGFAEVVWNDTLGWRQRIGPGVGSFYSHLSMPENFGADSLLGHELGHTLGLSHTFRDCVDDDCKTNPEWSGSPHTLTGIRNQIIADVSAYKHAPWDAAGILGALFDGDKASGVTDTPPDPNYKVWGTVFGDDWQHGEITHLCAPSATGIQMSITFGSPYYASYPFSFEPDRRNVLSYFKTCWNSNYHFFHYSPSQLAKINANLDDQLSFLSIATRTTDAWLNTLNVTIPARTSMLTSPPYAGSSTYVSGADTTAQTALVHVTMRTESGSYRLRLVAPDGTTKFTLQTANQNDGARFPLVDKTEYVVSIPSSVPKNGFWRVEAANEWVFYDDAYRYLDDWQLEFR